MSDTNQLYVIFIMSYTSALSQVKSRVQTEDVTRHSRVLSQVRNKYTDVPLTVQLHYIYKLTTYYVSVHSIHNNIVLYSFRYLPSSPY